ncbi:MAG: right-handed parallel beta-helix repeat-containing protein, partial [Saprospiraceae bacterium]|nr:right-handed parallel beta-helix repeat-containing protein [Saprospiraceae bacterium]
MRTSSVFKRITFLFIVVPLIVFCAVQLPAQTIYVKIGGSDANTGGSWGQAFATIQKALSVAASGDDIWVAQGTYFPDEGPTQVNNSNLQSFYLKAGVSVFGGFDGSETNFSQRDPISNITILSGEIQNDGDATNNSIHIVTARGMLSDGAKLNGFLIQDGYANNGGAFSEGAGIRIVSSAGVAVTRCVFLSNYASTLGGAMAIDSGSTPIINRCDFYNNTVLSLGGGAVVVKEGSSPVFNACSFRGNFGLGASVGGGASYISGSSAFFYSCLFSGNNAHTGGAVFCKNDDPSTFDGCTFSGNKANASGGAVYNDHTDTEFYNSIFWNNEASGSTSTSSAVFFNLTSSPQFGYCLFPVNVTVSGVDLGNNLAADPSFIQGIDPSVSPQLGGDFHLEQCSPVIDMGDSTNTQVTLDAGGQDRIVGENIDIG